MRCNVIKRKGYSKYKLFVGISAETFEKKRPRVTRVRVFSLITESEHKHYCNVSSTRAQLTRVYTTLFVRSRQPKKLRITLNFTLRQVGKDAHNYVVVNSISCLQKRTQKYESMRSMHIYTAQNSNETFTFLLVVYKKLLVAKVLITKVCTKFAFKE